MAGARGEGRIHASVLSLLAALAALSAGLGAHGAVRAGVMRPKAVAEIARIEGCVTVSPSGSDLWQEAAQGQAVYYGDRVRTGAGSWVVLTLSAGGSLTLGARCEVRLDSLVRLRLVIGRIWAAVNPALSGSEGFRVETPSAVVGVRGTEFSVCAKEDGLTVVSVSSGLVEVTGEGGTVVVHPGYSTRVRPGAAPTPPEPMGDDERRAWGKEKPGEGGGDEGDEGHEGDGGDEGDGAHGTRRGSGSGQPGGNESVDDHHSG